MEKAFFRTAACCSALMVFLAALNGCSSAGRSYTETEMKETLETEILPNTSKMFVYRLKWPETDIPNQVRIIRSDAPRNPYDRGGVEITRRTYGKLQENAAYVVQQEGYCREGFIELDHSMSRYHLWLKGECKEGASDADRTKFGEKNVISVHIND